MPHLTMGLAKTIGTSFAAEVEFDVFVADVFDGSVVADDDGA